MKTKKLILFSVILAMITPTWQFSQATEENEADINILTAKETNELEDTIEGKISGIGIEIDNLKDKLLVKRVLNGGGAEKAGLKAGEEIVSIEGRRAEEMPFNQAVDLIKGPVGTKVNLVMRGADGKSRDVSVERGIVLFSGVEGFLVEDNVWLIKVKSMNKQTPVALKSEIEGLVGKSVKGIILDLRGNTSGYYSAIVEIAGMFLADGQTMWLYKPQKGKMKRAIANGQLTKLPMVVLIDSNTGGCELIAAALKKNQRAKLIGEKTSGHAAMRKLVKNDDGSSEKVLIGRFFYKPQVPVTGRGIEPDIAIDPTLGEQMVISKAAEALLAQIAGQT